MLIDEIKWIANRLLLIKNRQLFKYETICKFQGYQADKSGTTNARSWCWDDHVFRRVILKEAGGGGMVEISQIFRYIVRRI